MKSRWKDMSEEQKQAHRNAERLRRAARKALMTAADMAERSEQRRLCRERRKQRDLQHHQSVAREYKRNGKGWFYSWANSIKQRAAKKGLPYDLDADYLQSIMPTHCPVLGVELKRRRTKSDDSACSPTVDRIVPALGYIRTNVIIVSRRANNIKSDASPEEIRKVAQYYETLIK
jgi:uncharacterized protein (DUF4415 family)